MNTTAILWPALSKVVITCLFSGKTDPCSIISHFKNGEEMGAMRTCFQILDKKVDFCKATTCIWKCLGNLRERGEGSGRLGGNVLRDQHTKGGVCKDSWVSNVLGASVRLQPNYLPLQCLYQLFPAHMQDAGGRGDGRTAKAQAWVLWLRSLGRKKWEENTSPGKIQHRQAIASTGKVSLPRRVHRSWGILITLSRGELCKRCFCVLSASPWPWVFTSFSKHLPGLCRC